MVELVESRFTVSMKNGGIALVISLTVGVLLGVIQTLNKDRLLDHIGAGYTVFVNAVPSIVAFSLILVFASRRSGTSVSLLIQKAWVIERYANCVSFFVIDCWIRLVDQEIYGR